MLALLREFRAQGITSILISHKLNEIREVADKITVLRDGKAVATLDCNTGEVERDDIIRKMVDRDLESRCEARSKSSEVIFEVKQLVSASPAASGAALGQERVVQGEGEGEIVGIAEVDGGRTHRIRHDLFRRSWGTNISGEARINGNNADISTVARAIKAGLAYVTEDRKKLTAWS